MSYAFNIRAATIALALVAVATKLDEVVTDQPAHEADKAQALASVDAFVNLLPEGKDGEELSITVSGAWEGSEVTAISLVSFGVQAGWVAAAEPA